MSGPAIRATGLRRVFGTTVAVAGLDLDVAHGEIYGLIGPDGAGKTTTIRMLAGILTPTAGSAEVLGVDVVAAPEAVKQRIGYVAQRFGLYEDLSVHENIRFFGTVFGIDAGTLRARREPLLAVAGLTPFVDRLAGQLSGGMKQKLALVCALTTAPSIVFLDEPTTGVDPVARNDFWELLLGLARGAPDAAPVTIVVSTPYMDEAERCDRVGLMSGGHLIREGAPAELVGAYPGALLAVRAKPLRPAARALAAALGDGAVALFGDRIHVRVSPGEHALPEAALAAVASAGIRVQRIEPATPSMEDVFIDAAGAL